MDRKLVKELLGRNDIEPLISASANGVPVMKHVIAMTFDKSSPLSWRAMEAAGRMAAVMSADDARNRLQRMLWMMREESGNNAWSAPEIIGEMIRHSPERFADIIPIIAHFHDEAIFTPGVLYALWRIAEVRPDLVKEHSPLIAPYLESEDPYKRALAALTLGLCAKDEYAGKIRALQSDSSLLRIFMEGELKEITVSEAAQKTLGTGML